MTKRWMSYFELAMLLKVSPQAAHDWAAKAQLPRAFKSQTELVLVPVPQKVGDAR
jgi:hypothetical protein